MKDKYIPLSLLINAALIISACTSPSVTASTPAPLSPGIPPPDATAYPEITIARLGTGKFPSAISEPSENQFEYETRTCLDIAGDGACNGSDFPIIVDSGVIFTYPEPDLEIILTPDQNGIAVTQHPLGEIAPPPIAADPTESLWIHDPPPGIIQVPVSGDWQLLCLSPSVRQSLPQKVVYNYAYRGCQTKGNQHGRYSPPGS